MTTLPAQTVAPVHWKSMAGIGLMLLLLSLLWGGSFFFTGIAVKELPPLTIVALRVGIAALMLLTALPLFGLALPRRADLWAAFLGMGLKIGLDENLDGLVAGMDFHAYRCIAEIDFVPTTIVSANDRVRHLGLLP